MGECELREREIGLAVVFLFFCCWSCRPLFVVLFAVTDLLFAVIDLAVSVGPADFGSLQPPHSPVMQTAAISTTAPPLDGINRQFRPMALSTTRCRQESCR